MGVDSVLDRAFRRVQPLNSLPNQTAGVYHMASAAPSTGSSTGSRQQRHRTLLLQPASQPASQSASRWHSSSSLISEPPAATAKVHPPNKPAPNQLVPNTVQRQGYSSAARIGNTKQPSSAQFVVGEKVRQ